MDIGVRAINNKLGLPSLIGVVVGAMIGGGLFNLPSDMAAGAHSGAVLIGWVITGIGMIALALCFQNLAVKKPELDGGVYSYARAGFGEYVGFNSAFGYWLSAFLGTIASFTLLFNSLSYFFPIFGEGNNMASMIGASALLWTYHFLVLRGMKEATLVNLVTTIAKLIPVVLFIIVMVIAFNMKTFTFEFFGPGEFSWSSLFEQTRSTMLVTLWVFIGVEGAVVLSGRAKNKKDVGRATVIGLLGTLAIYIMISMLSLGVMPKEELASLKSPSTAYVLEYVVGPWGAILINVGLIISLVGTLLGWTILACEIPYVASKDKLFPKMFNKVNKNESPSASLWVTSGIMQIFFVLIAVTSSTYQALYSMASTAMLLPYLFSALYQVKITVNRDGYNQNEVTRKQLIIGIIASVYAAWLIYAAGLTYLLSVTTLYFIGLVFYWKAKKESNERMFTKYEAMLALIIVVAAVTTVYLITTGQMYL
ncbi:arginine-ornithine antiporter [Priestia taiwanensis]